MELAAPRPGQRGAEACLVVLLRCCHGGGGSKAAWSEDVQVYSRTHSHPGKRVSLFRELQLQAGPWSLSAASKSWLSVMSGWPSGLRHQTQDSIFQRAGSLHQVAKVLELQRQSFQWTLRADFFKDLLVWSSCCPRDSQESPLAPQFENINSLALILLSIFISSPGCPEANVKAAVT